MEEELKMEGEVKVNVKWRVMLVELVEGLVPYRQRWR